MRVNPKRILTWHLDERSIAVIMLKFLFLMVKVWQNITRTNMVQLKSVLDPKDYKYNKTSNQKTTVMVDFM